MQKKNLLVQTLFVLFEFVIFVVIAGTLTFAYFNFAGPTGAASDTIGSIDINPVTELVQYYLPVTFILLLTTYIVKVFFFKIPEIELGYTDKRIVKDSALGWGLGLLLVGVGFVILYLFNQVEINGVDYSPYFFFGFILFFIVQSFSEEIIFRSFLIPMIQNRIGTLAALIISSLLFFVVHLGNPNASWMGMINLICGGLLMGLLFLKYKNIWMPTGFHASWNFVQSAFLGFPVSGLEIYSLVELEETGNDYITGGAFGYEGSLISIIILLITITYLLKTDKALYQSLFEPVHHPLDKSFH